MRLFIAIPSQDEWNADFAMSVVGMNQHIYSHPFGDEMGLSIINQRGSLIQGSREELVEQALEVDATHILFLDSDMQFPDDTCHRLMAHNLPAVACNYTKRMVPATTNTKDENGLPMLTLSDSTGLEEASSSGFGVALFDAEIFKKLSRPWFDCVWLQKSEGKVYWPEKLTLVGEDVFFFKKLKHELGITLMIDHDLSKEIAHIGTFQYTNNLAEIQ